MIPLYPTEKNPLLLERIIKASSNERDYILDGFVGSGTTIDIATQLKRKWIGIYNSLEAINHIFKRFFYGLKEMGDFVKTTNFNGLDRSNQLNLFDNNEDQNEFIPMTNFEFLSDQRFYDVAVNLINKYNILN